LTRSYKLDGKLARMRLSVLCFSISAARLLLAHLDAPGRAVGPDELLLVV
jgi:hypothetical protein